MAPHGEELLEQARNQIVRLHKDGIGYKIISRLLNRSQNTVVVVVRWYRRTHTANNRRGSGRTQKTLAHTIHTICNLALKNRQARASDLA